MYRAWTCQDSRLTRRSSQVLSEANPTSWVWLRGDQGTAPGELPKGLIRLSDRGLHVMLNIPRGGRRVKCS